jgi:uncharacterized protein
MGRIRPIWPAEKGVPPFRGLEWTPASLLTLGTRISGGGGPANMGWMNDARETLTWELYGGAARALAQQVAADGYRPDIILAIARGGLFVAGSLGYSLSVKNLYVMNIEYYTGVGTRLDVPVMLPPYQDSMNLDGARILIADDVADTGNTIRVVHDHCQGRVADVRTAVLYEKPHSLVSCEYVWRYTDKWINFPWSTEPPLVGPPGGGDTVFDA